MVVDSLGMSEEDCFFMRVVVIAERSDGGTFPIFFFLLLQLFLLSVTGAGVLGFWQGLRFWVKFEGASLYPFRFLLGFTPSKRSVVLRLGN